MMTLRRMPGYKTLVKIRDRPVGVLSFKKEEWSIFKNLINPLRFRKKQIMEVLDYVADQPCDCLEADEGLHDPECINRKALRLREALQAIPGVRIEEDEQL